MKNNGEQVAGAGLRDDKIKRKEMKIKKKKKRFG